VSRPRAIGAAMLLAAGVAAGHARAEAPPCIASAEVEPERPFVGQQVLYRARILRREDVDQVEWVQPPAFPDLRAEWLPGRAEDTRVTRHGARYLVREDQRALFAAWDGRIALPTFELRCAGRIVPLPGPSLDVRRLPQARRPADFSGLIGPIEVRTRVDRASLPLGQSLRVSVRVRGDANLWDLQPPLAELEAAGVEVFRRPAQLDVEAGERLYLQRHFPLDVVPRAEGRLEIPSVRIPYYDPRSGRYALATSEPIAIDVGPRAGGAAARPADAASGDEEEGSGPGARTGAALVAILLIGGTGAVAWRRALAGRARRRAIEDALARADRCREARDPIGEAAALARALSQAAAAAGPRRSEALAAEIEAQRARLDAVRFSGVAGDPARDDALGLIRRLRARPGSPGR